MMVGPRGFSLVTIFAWGGGVAMTGDTLCGVALKLWGRSMTGPGARKMFKKLGIFALGTGALGAWDDILGAAGV